MICSVFGADNAIRTRDLILTKDVLCLLSYISIYRLASLHIGRGRRIRTLGTWFWRPLLYQLSYTPILPTCTRIVLFPVVGHQGLEPRTDRL